MYLNRDPPEVREEEHPWVVVHNLPLMMDKEGLHKFVRRTGCGVYGFKLVEVMDGCGVVSKMGWMRVETEQEAGLVVEYLAGQRVEGKAVQVEWRKGVQVQADFGEVGGADGQGSASLPDLYPSQNASAAAAVRDYPLMYYTASSSTPSHSTSHRLAYTNSMSSFSPFSSTSPSSSFPTAVQSSVPPLPPPAASAPSLSLSLPPRPEPSLTAASAPAPAPVPATATRGAVIDLTLSPSPSPEPSPEPSSSSKSSPSFSPPPPPLQARNHKLPQDEPSPPNTAYQTQQQQQHQQEMKYQYHPGRAPAPPRPTPMPTSMPTSAGDRRGREDEGRGERERERVEEEGEGEGKGKRRRRYASR
ncbi:hypothetical protein JCM11641_004884 [Rhodosporidiobolus odoratus]